MLRGRKRREHRASRAIVSSCGFCCKTGFTVDLGRLTDAYRRQVSITRGRPGPRGVAAGETSARAGIVLGSMSATTTLLLIIVCVLAGAIAGVAAARRGERGEAEREARERERMRDELKSISLDVLARTGESLAARLEDQRPAAQERAAGEMARRSEEIKGLVAPVQDKLGRMERAIGRLERERRQAHGELGQMVRDLGEGVRTLRHETGTLVSALKRPSP